MERQGLAEVSSDMRQHRLRPLRAAFDGIHESLLVLLRSHGFKLRPGAPGMAL